MQTIKEFTDYLFSFNKISKTLFIITYIICTLLYIACFIVLSLAGKSISFYTAHELFYILTENAKGLLAVGMIGTIVFEILQKNNTIEE